VIFLSGQLYHSVSEWKPGKLAAGDDVTPGQVGNVFFFPKASFDKLHVRQTLSIQPMFVWRMLRYCSAKHCAHCPFERRLFGRDLAAMDAHRFSVLAELSHLLGRPSVRKFCFA